MRNQFHERKEKWLAQNDACVQIANPLWKKEEKKIYAKLEPLRSEVKELLIKKGFVKENSIPGKNISSPQILAGNLPDLGNLLTPESDCKRIYELLRAQNIRPFVACSLILREQIKQFNEEVKKQKAN